jgi:hypothetical protein
MIISPKPLSLFNVTNLKTSAADGDCAPQNLSAPNSQTLEFTATSTFLTYPPRRQRPLWSHQVQGSDVMIKLMIITLIIAAQRRGIGAVKTCPQVNFRHFLSSEKRNQSSANAAKRTDWRAAFKVDSRSGLATYAFCHRQPQFTLALQLCKIVVASIWRR